MNNLAIIGDGPAALACFLVLRHTGVPAEAITVYGDSPHPLAQLEQLARAIGQRMMRSESNGHLAPTEFPTLAIIDAWQRRSPWPLLLSLFDAYVPSFELVLANSAQLARRSGFALRKVQARVASLVRQNSPEATFTLFDSAGEPLGSSRHVILALGLPGLAWPPVTQGWQDHPCVCHSYQAPTFQRGEHVTVMGSGMTAAHLWMVALEAGARVTAIHRDQLLRQPLNVPRYSFSAPGFDAYRRLGQEERRSFHRTRKGSFPWRWAWELTLWRSRRSGAFRTYQGEVVRIEEQQRSEQAGKLHLQLADGHTISADKLICATGVQTDACGHALIKQLVTAYQVPMVDGMLCVADDFTLPALSRPGSVCGVVGALARWVLPVAETFFGMKYAARSLAPIVQASNAHGGNLNTWSMSHKAGAKP